MQHDFTLPPNGSQQIDVTGRFFKYKKGAGMIRVRTTSGGYIDLMPGQGVENEQFTSLTVSDRTGLGNTGVILAGNFDFRDETISGTVDVVDGGRTRTLGNQAFMVAGYRPASVGNFSHYQCFNPVGSGKNIYVEQIFTQTPLANVNVGFGWTSAPLATPVGFVAISKKSGATNVNGVMVPYGEDSAASKLLVLLGSLPDKAMLPLKEPILIAPGYGLCFRGNQTNQEISVLVEYFEEPI